MRGGDVLGFGACRNSLAAKEFPRKRVIHLSVTGSYHYHSTIHKSSTSDHVLDVISVTRTINMGIVASRCFVFDVRRRDGDTTFPLLRGFIDGSIIQKLCEALLGLSFCDGRGQCSLDI